MGDLRLWITNVIAVAAFLLAFNATIEAQGLLIGWLLALLSLLTGWWVTRGRATDD